MNSKCQLFNIYLHSIRKKILCKIEACLVSNDSESETTGLKTKFSHNILYIYLIKVVWKTVSNPINNFHHIKHPYAIIFVFNYNENS